MIPEKLNDWHIEKLNSLVSLRNIESEGFEFKGPEFKELSHHICAMVNTSGGYIALGVGETRNVKTDHFIGFEKNGFVLGKEQKIECEINNARINVDPDPTMDYRNQLLYIIPI